MLALLHVVLLASSVSAMFTGLPHNNYRMSTRRIFAPSPFALGFTDKYMKQLEAVKPQKIASLDQAFYKHTEVWKKAVGEFTSDYWKMNVIPALDHADNFKFYDSVNKFNYMTNQLHCSPSTDPLKFFRNPLYKGREEYLSKIPVELVFEWVDVLEEMNLRQRSIVLENEKTVRLLESEKVSQLSRASELEKTVRLLESEKVSQLSRASELENTVAGLREEMARFKAELESARIALKQAEETTADLVLRNSIKIKELESNLDISKGSLEAEKRNNSELIEQNKKLDEENNKATENFEQAKRNLEAFKNESEEKSKEQHAVMSAFLTENVSAVTESMALHKELMSSNHKTAGLSEDLNRCKKEKAELRKQVSELETELSHANGTVNPYATDDWFKYE